MKSRKFIRNLIIIISSLIFFSLIVNFSGADPNQTVGKGEISLLVGGKELWHASQGRVSWYKKPGPGKGYIESLTMDQTGQKRVLLCQSGVVWMSEDEGINWGPPIFESVDEEGVAAVFHPKDPKRLLLATNKRLLISSNAGNDWAEATPGLSFKWRPLSILTSGYKPDRMYVMTRGNGIYRSNDSGQNWTAINTGLPKAIGAAPIAPIESALLDPTNPDVVYIVAEAKGIYKTANGGRSWVRVSKGLPDIITHRTSPWALAIDTANPQRLLVWASWPVHSERVDKAFFLTEDGAKSWRKIAPGPDQGRVFDIKFIDANIGLAVAITEDGDILLSN